MNSYTPLIEDFKEINRGKDLLWADEGYDQCKKD